MNKKAWVGIYLGSFLIFVTALVVLGLFLLLLMEQLIGQHEQITALVLGLGILAYLQFVLVSTIYNFALLSKMWAPLQDGINPITVGKAIGFLFIPVFSVYWIFRAWGDFPNQYNNYIERHNLNVPPVTSRSYVAFPFILLLTGFLVFPLLALPAVCAVMIARTADAVNNLAVATNAAYLGVHADSSLFVDNSHSRAGKSIAVAYSALFIGSIAIGGIFLHNARPNPTKFEVPNSVAGFTKETVYSSGSFLGLRSEFRTTYEVPGKVSGKQTLEYEVNHYLTEGLAIKETGYFGFSPCNTAKGNQLTSSVSDASGKAVGDIMLCDTGLLMRNGKYRVRISQGYTRDEPVSQDRMMQFVKALPFNEGLSFGQLSPTTNGPGSQTPGSPGPAQKPVSTDAPADSSMTAEEFYAATNGPMRRSAEVRFKDKTVEIAGRYYLLNGDTAERIYLQAGGSNTVTATPAAGRASDFAGLQDDSRLRVKCTVVTKYTIGLENCVLIENKGPLSTDDVPERSFTAKQYYELIHGSSGSANWDKFRGKAIKISGKVMTIGDKPFYLATGKYEWVSCKPDPENEKTFAGLTDGSDATLIGVGGIAGDLKHCIAIGR